MKRYRTDLIMAPRRQDDKRLNTDASTEDIMAAVMYADPLSAKYTVRFAPTIKGATVRESCRNIWQFLKDAVSYKIDPVGYQFVQSPGRLWYNRGVKKVETGDCKSFSVFTASCLHNLGIRYQYRFAAYKDAFGKPQKRPTHVYVIAYDERGQRVIIDAVWKGPFNTEKWASNIIDVSPGQAIVAITGTCAAQRKRVYVSAFYWR